MTGSTQYIQLYLIFITLFDIEVITPTVLDGLPKVA